MQASETSCHRLFASGRALHAHPWYADLTRYFVLRDLLHRLGRDHLTFSSTGTACNSASHAPAPAEAVAMRTFHMACRWPLSTSPAASIGLPVDVREAFTV
jgi:hypothetical protein